MGKKVKCPFCGSLEDKVIDSRASKDGRAIRRRRGCLNCGNRFTTYEYIEKIPLAVVKNDGRREPFDRQKLLLGIVTACKKRPISIESIESLVDEIQNELLNLGRSEVETKMIGELVMEKLQALDEVAYVRFASVYRKFKDKNQFMEELKKLLE